MTKLVMLTKFKRQSTKLKWR